MIKASVIGDKGRLGVPLVKLIKNHPDAILFYTYSRRDEEEFKPEMLEKSDIVFLSLPEGSCSLYLPYIQGRMIDLSQDHRTVWAYGIPELNRIKIMYADAVSNPGCHATAIGLAVTPIKRFIEKIIANSYTGVSGKPKQPVIENGPIEQYKKEREHKHIIEIEHQNGKKIINSLNTYLVYSLKTGIYAEIEADIKASKTEVEEAYNTFYEKAKFVKLKEFNPIEITPNNLEERLKPLWKTNYCELSFDVTDGRIKIISELDNLYKGGSGQAIQNMNLMFKLPEETGLI